MNSGHGEGEGVGKELRASTKANFVVRFVVVGEFGHLKFENMSGIIRIM